jgi:Predicted ATP-dependent serine protease
MAKEKTVYVCNNCGQESPKWIGKCPSCGEWNTYVEQVIRKESGPQRVATGMDPVKSKPIALDAIETKDDPRIDMHAQSICADIQYFCPFHRRYAGSVYPLFCIVTGLYGSFFFLSVQAL